MKRVNISLSILLLFTIVLSSCSTVVRETKFVRNEWPEEYQSPFGDQGRPYIIRDMPSMTISSPCVSKSYLSIGPFFAVPLPLIPNPLWPFTYLSYRNTHADLVLTLDAPRKLFDDNKPKIELLLDGIPLEVTKVEDTSEGYYYNLKYTYDTKKTCKQIENLKIKVRVSGSHESIEEIFRYMRHWWIFAEGC